MAIAIFLWFYLYISNNFITYLFLTQEKIILIAHVPFVDPFLTTDFQQTSFLSYLS